MKTSTSSRVLMIVLLSAAGAWISGELLKHQADLWGSAASRTGLLDRVCKAVAPGGLDCTGPLHSRMSQIAISVPQASAESWIEFRTVHVPVAFAGLAYFLFVGIWYAFIGPARTIGRRWHALPLAVTSAGLLTSLYLGGNMALGRAPLCLWCVIIHMSNLLIVVAVWSLRRTALPSLPPSESDLPPARLARQVLTFREAATTLTFILTVIVGLWIYRSERMALQDRLVRLSGYKQLVRALSADPDFVLREYHAQPLREFLPEDEHPASLAGSVDHGSRESATADQDDSRAELVVFTDYECPACACPSRGIQRAAVTAFEGRLDVRVRHFPLSAECNPQVTTHPHPNACDAAYAAEAARLQGGEKAFWRMHDLLYRNRRNLHKAIYPDLAAQLALNVRQFLSDLYSHEVQAAVAADIELARKLDVRSAPTMFLNGREVPPLIQGPVFWQAAAREWFAARGQPLVRTAGFEPPTRHDLDCDELEE